MGLLIILKGLVNWLAIGIGLLVLAIISTLIVIPIILIFLVLGPKYTDKYLQWNYSYIYGPSFEGIDSILRRLNTI